MWPQPTDPATEPNETDKLSIVDITKAEDGDSIVSIGGMWEDQQWSITYDANIGFAEKTFMCHHCRDWEEQSDQGNPHGPSFVCPRVVVATNEGGFNSTGVCLDCILEAAGRIAKPDGVHSI